MFLVTHHHPHGGIRLVFLVEDPHRADAIPNVTFDHDGDVRSWPDGTEQPVIALGRDPNDPKHYREFRSARGRQAAGYEPVEGMALAFATWEKYMEDLGG
jgi:hypothetical protein